MRKHGSQFASIEMSIHSIVRHTLCIVPKERGIQFHRMVYALFVCESSSKVLFDTPTISIDSIAYAIQNYG